MLKRGIRKWDLVFLIINSVIGAGIFGLPAKAFALSGPYSLLAFGVCAVVMLVLILVFMEVSSRFDKTGGPYLYIKEAFGSMPAFAVGWILMLTRLFSYATLINLLVIYMAFFSPIFQEEWMRILMIVGITGVLTGINLLGIKDSTRTTNILTISKLVPLTLFIVIGLFFLNQEAFDFSAPPPMPEFANTALLLIFAFGGFEAGLVISGEVENPRKNLPFALMTGALIITVFYVLIQVVAIGTLPDLATSDKPLADAATRVMGYGGGLFITIGAIVSILGTLNVQILSGSRLPFALSESQQFPKIFSFIHPRFRTPTVAVLFFAFLIIIVATVWDFMGSLAISVIARLLIYLLVCGSLIRLRKSQPDADYYKVKFGIPLAIAGIGATIWLLSSTQLEEITDMALWTALGFVIYGVHKIFSRKLEQ
ncbi:APC family permease [Algoriphagus aquimarinus]|uniref:Arginine/agmatine antiporter n=1 Tax=Algoriphagus aquimarinus TaxID=237018 RepID=A0A5C7B2R9_9BACT|nr:APC family permease [Algoriphagus aquimarinus]TXE14283.1 amino acid permease [Algoriphagus aquimarinus]